MCLLAEACRQQELLKKYLLEGKQVSKERPETFHEPSISLRRSEPPPSLLAQSTSSQCVHAKQ